MHDDFFTYMLKFKLLIAGNHKPRLRNVDAAMRRRLHLLPLMVTFGLPRICSTAVARKAFGTDWRILY
jgi:phage/plasmid-associated DNA primase